MLYKEVKVLTDQVRCWRKEMQEQATTKSDKVEEERDIIERIKKTDNAIDFLNNEKRFLSDLPKDVAFRSRLVNIFYFKKVS